MEPQLEQIRDQQKETWNKFSSGWKKWDEFTMNFLKPFGDEMIAMIKPKDEETILDIASGTGEPGLTIAGLIKNGKVILTDLSDGMLQTATENAEKKGLKNVETVVCDVSALPFADNTFDAVCCRMGFMFFPDMKLALTEITRVLKPGGRLAAAVWNVSDKNPWITIMMSTIARNIQLPAPQPGAPGMFRCAAPEFMTSLFTGAGLINVIEKETDQKLNIGSAETYWSFHNEVGAPIVAAMSKADEATKAKIKTEVFELLHRNYADDNVFLEYSARVIYGEKPTN